jgi:hypothetical protein
MDTKTKEIEDFRGFENYVFKQSKIFGIPENLGDFHG